MSEAAGHHFAGRLGQSFLAALVTVLATFGLAGPASASAGWASSSITSVAETRVGASTAPGPVLVGGSEGVGAGQRPGQGLARAELALTTGVAAEATTASKPLIIGENMDRVRAYAEQVGGHAYRPWTNSDLALGMQRNGRMIKDVMRADREIIYIGPDSARRAAGRDPSPFYNLERQLTDGYDNYIKRLQAVRTARRRVPGLDF